VLGKEINLGANAEISIGELAEKIFQLVGRSPRIITDAERMRPKASEVYRLHADNSQAQALIDWSPQVSLEEGLERTIAWIQAYLDRYRPKEYQV
jgi:dTDP-glucose 4,6-dehydratase